MYDPNADAPPFNPLPPVVVLLAVLIALPEAVFQLGEAGIIGGGAGGSWRLAIGSQLGIFNGAVHWMWQTAQFLPEHLIRFVTYPFFHDSLVSAIFSEVFLLALGKYAAERIHWGGVLAIFFGSAIVAGLAFAIAWPANTLLLGAGAATYGLVGAFSWLRFLEDRANGGNGLVGFRVAAALIALQIFFALVFQSREWLDHLVGLFAGVGLAALVQPTLTEGFSSWPKKLRASRDA